MHVDRCRPTTGVVFHAMREPLHYCSRAIIAFGPAVVNARGRPVIIFGQFAKWVLTMCMEYAMMVVSGRDARRATAGLRRPITTRYKAVLHDCEGQGAAGG